jgi:predicted amidohydrolase
MPTSLTLATIQMNAAPAALDERLERAAALVGQAAQSGARLVVLPELFNSGYEYSERNYRRAETIEGPTATWMKATAAQYNIHLAGSFLRRDGTSIYNTMLLLAPDGRQWTYDKNYPWMWERAYFQKGSGITVAETVLGKIGLLICWDVAHANLWRQYAGKVDLMVVSSCPPRALDFALLLPDGRSIRGANAGGLIGALKRSSDETFGALLRRQAAWLGVPLVQAAVTGAFVSSLPHPGLSYSFLGMMAPSLFKYVSQFKRSCVESGYFEETYIADASGTVLQRVPAGVEGLALGELILPDAPPKPAGKQPAFGIPKYSYWLDFMINALFAAEYRRKMRRQMESDLGEFQPGQ